MGCMHSLSCPSCDGTYLELEALRQKLETANAEIRQLKGPCTCSHDPAHAGGACGICHANALLQLDSEKANLKAQYEENMRLILEIEAAQHRCDKMRLRAEAAELQVDELRKLAIRLCKDSDNLFCKQPGCEGCEDMGITEKRTYVCGLEITDALHICRPPMAIGQTSNYRCLSCDWVATPESRPLSRGMKVGCPKCGKEAEYK